MWHKTFESRLSAWNDLRQQCILLNKEPCLAAINHWWFQTPWCAYHLHWDDCVFWPDPWELLADNLFCSLARGLGIIYTIAMLDRADLKTATLIDTGSDNLVVIDSGKYILNWDPQQTVNINLAPYRTVHKLELEHILSRIK